jgi:hypothetical protein
MKPMTLPGTPDWTEIVIWIPQLQYIHDSMEVVHAFA